MRIVAVKLDKDTYLEYSPEEDFYFIENDICIRKEATNGKIVSVDIDSGSVISGRLTGLGFFLEEEADGEPEKEDAVEHLVEVVLVLALQDFSLLLTFAALFAILSLPLIFLLDLPLCPIINLFSDLSPSLVVHNVIVVEKEVSDEH